jgi:hypothetical protein
VAEGITIQGGYGGVSLVEDYLLAASIPKEQDPDVVRRCPDVLIRALRLCQRFDEQAHAEPYEDGPNELATPKVGYESSQHEGVSGTVRLIAYVMARRGVLVLDDPSNSVGLWCQAPGESEELMTVVAPDGIIIDPSGMDRAGRQSHLNAFDMMTGRISETAFPQSAQRTAPAAPVQTVPLPPV